MKRLSIELQVLNYMSEINWTKFTKKISINSNAQTIFSSWTSQDSLEKWFLSKAEFKTSDNTPKDRMSQIEKGDKYTWMWYGSDIIEEGEVLENNGKDYLKITFTGCDVSVEIKEESGETVVELIQSNIPLDEISRMDYYVGCTEGWTFYLANLKSILEGGIDLRNRNIDLVGVINT